MNLTMVNLIIDAYKAGRRWNTDYPQPHTFEEKVAFDRGAKECIVAKETPRQSVFHSPMGVSRTLSGLFDDYWGDLGHVVTCPKCYLTTPLETPGKECSACGSITMATNKFLRDKAPWRRCYTCDYPFLLSDAMQSQSVEGAYLCPACGDIVT